MSQDVVVERAVFASASTARSSGYQIVAASRGLLPSQLRQLTRWCPTHDSLPAPGSEGRSINFHPLADDCFCVARTMAGGQEPSRRRGPHVVTHCLIITAGGFSKFHNNPFAVLRAADRVENDARPAEPASYEPLALMAEGPAMNTDVVRHCSKVFGPQPIAQLLDLAGGERPVACVGWPAAELLIEGVLNLLPIDSRTAISFSTGLRYSPQRPFHLQMLPADDRALRRASRSGSIRLVGPNDPFELESHWAQTVERQLTTDDLELLAQAVARSGCRADGNCDGADQRRESGNRYLSAHAAHGNSSGIHAMETTNPSGCSTMSAETESIAGELISSMSWGLPEAAAKSTPSVQLQELGIHLNQAVARAIAGDPQAAAQIELLWSAIQCELAEELIDQARENYLRYALTLWKECLADDAAGAERAIAALDVVSMLFSE